MHDMHISIPPVSRRLLPILGMASAILLCGCPRSPSQPPPDTCDAPGTASIGTVELGAASLSSLFEPWEDGGVVPIVWGLQGTPMLGLRLRVQDAATDCIPQRTRITSVTGLLIREDDTPLHIYPQEDGSYLTETHYLLFESPFPGEGAWLNVETTVGAATSKHTVWLDAPYDGPSLAAIEPASVDLREGGRTEVTVSLDAPAPKHIVVLVHVSEPSVATISWPEVVISTGEMTGKTFVEGKAVGGPVKFLASVGDQWLDAPVTVRSRLISPRSQQSPAPMTASGETRP